MTFLKDRFEGAPRLGRPGARTGERTAGTPAPRLGAEGRGPSRAGVEEAQDLAARRAGRDGRRRALARRGWALPLTW